MWDFLDLICAIHVKTENRSLLLKFSLLKKQHFLDLVSSIHEVTITIGFSNINRSLLKKWHFLDLICAIYVVTMRAEVYFAKSPLLKKWHFLNLICSLQVVTITTGFSFSNRSLLKKWHFLDLVCAYKFEFCTKIRMHPAQPRFARPGGVHNNRICLKKWHFPDLVCSVHVLTITSGLSYRSRLKKVALSGPIMFSTCSNHQNWVKL